jgi:hypothetical protein
MIRFRWVRLLSLASAFVSLAFGQAPAAPDTEIAGTAPMKLEAPGTGVSGQLVVAAELTRGETRADLVYTITREPAHGRVGLAGGADEDDFYKNKTSRLGYFAYQPQADYVGEDSFSYTVRNENSGVVFKGEVAITVTPVAPLELDKLTVKKDRDRLLNVQPVVLATRPNTAVAHAIPNHQDFMTPADRAAITDAKVIYALDDHAKPAHGTAKLDRQTGQLTYAPNPGFIGEDRFRYYTADENNPALGVENEIVVSVEPIRDFKTLTADRTKSRQVDLVFVINNSPSMAPHQARIAENLRRFRQLFDAKQLDYRIGVLTTDFVNSDDGAANRTYFKKVRSTEIDANGQPVRDRNGKPKTTTKQVASNGSLVTLPVLPEPWITPKTPDGIFAELVKVGTNGDSNRTAFTSVYNFVSNYSNHLHNFLRPDATTIVVFFMDEEETRMATWKVEGEKRTAEWVENGRLPQLLAEFNKRNPTRRQTLDSYIQYWVLRPFIIVKGNKRGKLEMHAVVSPTNVSHRRAAELTGGTVLNIDEDFSGSLAALGDRIADTVAVALDPVGAGATLYRKSIRVLVDGQEVKPDPQNGWVYDELTHSIRFQGEAKKRAFAAKIDVTYEEHR